MDEIKHLLGQRIKELRTKNGYSQQKLAELINIDQRNLSNIECGNTFPTKTLLKLSEILNVSLSDLFDFNSLPENDNEMKKYIISHLDNLSSNDIKVLYKLIKAMY